MKYLKKFENYASYEEAKPNLILPNVSLCVQENEVYYKPYVDPYNGHAYVDLGLPSGTKWATMNVGATSETDYGLYFQWGDTQGYTASQVGSGEGQKKFYWEDYKYGNGTSSPSAAGMSKYNATDGKTVLDLEDDAVAVNWGGSWHMPTETQFQELLNTTYNTSVTDYQGSGINGCLFTSKTNGNTLFIPGGGYAYEGSAPNVGYYGYVWSSSLSSSNAEYGRSLDFDSRADSARVIGYGRYYGQSVRGVVG